jgi:hypothetical protein
MAGLLPRATLVPRCSRPKCTCLRCSPKVTCLRLSRAPPPRWAFNFRAFGPVSCRLSSLHSDLNLLLVRFSQGNTGGLVCGKSCFAGNGIGVAEFNLDCSL